MPRLVYALPKLRQHRASGQAVVTLGGRDVYLGTWNSAASRQAYDRLVAQWLVDGREHRLPSTQLTIHDMIARYWLFAEQHYRKHDEPTGEQANIKFALRPLQALYGDTPAAEFGPLKLKAIRERMVEDGLSRRVVNQRVNIIKRVFRWATSEELIPSSVDHGLSALASLKKGRSAARESAPVQPISEAIVNVTIPHLPPVVRAMVRIQLLTGCRPGEVCAMRPCDVDRSAAVWQYRPASHKIEHWERSRVILIGPQAQAILAPYLDRAPDAFCFSPAESEEARKRELRAKRKTKVQPSQLDRSKPDPGRTAGHWYAPRSYLRAIYRACEKARVTRWSPNQLRHLAATKLRAAYGLESAQIVLGHAKPDTTLIYAARDVEKAAAIMAQAG